MSRAALMFQCMSIAKSKLSVRKYTVPIQILMYVIPASTTMSSRPGAAMKPS